MLAKADRAQEVSDVHQASYAGLGGGQASEIPGLHLASEGSSEELFFCEGICGFAKVMEK